MKIINIKTIDIKPYDKNPRKNDGAVDLVANSIKEFGFKVPIIIDKNNIIVAGHTRHKAAKKLGLKEVPVIVADDLTPKQIKAFRLADNKVAEKAEWDFNLLGAELEGLDLNMADFGFDILELDPKNLGEDFNLPSGDKGNIEQITFTLSNDQAEYIKDLLEQAKSNDDFKEYNAAETLNTNKNGNALYWLITTFADGGTL